MPIDLVLVRHGESELNFANRRSRSGDKSVWTPEFRGRHSSAAHLTDTGREQAKAAGLWLQSEGLTFDRFLVSRYARAMQTAGLLGLPDAEWLTHPSLRERDAGDLEMLTDEERFELFEDALRKRHANPLYWRPPNGNSIAEEAELLYAQILGSLHREMGEKSVIIVCHGEKMTAWQYLLERMPDAKWIARHQSRNPLDHMHNCQILHYTRRDPVTGEISAHLDWMRSVCPWDLSKSRNVWEKIERLRYSNEELLALVDSLDPMIPATT